MKSKTKAFDFLTDVASVVLENGITPGISLWQTAMNQHSNCAARCIFGFRRNDKSCASCLEGRLRTANLYKQVSPDADCPLLKAADELRAWTTPTAPPVMNAA